MPYIIGCLSQKGGVGKSTITSCWRAPMPRQPGPPVSATSTCGSSVPSPGTSYAAGRHRAKDRRAPLHLPYSHAPRSRRCCHRRRRPDSDQSSLEIARLATLIVLPTGLALDNLHPTLLFANELVQAGIQKERLLFVLNKVTDSELAVAEARAYLAGATGYTIADQDLAARTGYQMA